MSEHTLLNKQLWVIAAALPGLLTVFGVWKHAGELFAQVARPQDDPASRLAFVAHWLILPGATLLAGVVAVSGWRAGLAQAIDGTRAPVNRGLEITLRYNQNTLEQLVLAAIAWTGIALTVSPDQTLVIPALACLFVLGRITFWIGYLLHPQARAFGMVVTALPTFAAYGWLIVRLWSSRSA
jgi:hypothetical protein